MTHKKKLAANTEHEYYVTKADLPVSCPTKEMELWNAHPRVYLAFENKSEEICPYCSAKFILKNF